MSTMASRITSLTIVYSTVYSRRRSKKVSKLRVIGLCEGNLPATGEFPVDTVVTRKMFPFDDVIMIESAHIYLCQGRWLCNHIFSGWVENDTRKNDWRVGSFRGKCFHLMRSSWLKVHLFTYATDDGYVITFFRVGRKWYKEKWLESRVVLDHHLD